MAARIHRVTMFKVPKPEGQQKLLEAYKKLATDQQKDGKPYIHAIVTGQAMEDQRSKGWTVVSKTEFVSLEDMRFYDEQCEAHAALKATAKTCGIEGGPSGVLTVYFEASVAV